MFKPILALAALALIAPAFADDPQPPGDPVALLGEATTALNSGEIATARKAAEKATTALAIKQGETIRATLPAPFDGWTVNDEDTTNMGMLALGGGVAVNRTYNNADGTDVRVEILADSDMVTQMAQMFTSAEMLAAAGMKTETINGETGIVDPSDGKIIFVLDNRSMFTISGSAPAEVRKSYAQNINFAGFRAIK